MPVSVEIISQVYIFYKEMLHVLGRLKKIEVPILFLATFLVSRVVDTWGKDLSVNQFKLIYLLHTSLR
jgi:hypothetical protein